MYCTSFYKMSYSRKRSYQGGVRRDGLPPYIKARLKPYNLQEPGAYIRTLINPEGSPNAVIPDEATYPSELYTQRQSVQVTANAQGCAGIKIVVSNVPTYYTEAAASADGAYTYNGVSAFEAQADVRARFAAARLVAASVRAEFVGNDQNNQGYVLGSVYTKADTILATGLIQPNANWGTENTAYSTTLDSHRNNREAYYGPAKNGVYATYRPIDSGSFDMKPIAIGPAETLGFGTFLLHAGGMATTAVVIFHITMHYEGIRYHNAGVTDYTLNETSVPVVDVDEFSLTHGVLPVVPLIWSGLEYQDGTVGAVADYFGGAFKSKAGNMLRKSASLLGGLGRSIL